MLVTFGPERVNVIFYGILLSLACLSPNVRMILFRQLSYSSFLKLYLNLGLNLCTCVLY